MPQARHAPCQPSPLPLRSRPVPVRQGPRLPCPAGARTARPWPAAAPEAPRPMPATIRTRWARLTGQENAGGGDRKGMRQQAERPWQVRGGPDATEAGRWPASAAGRARATPALGITTSPRRCGISRAATARSRRLKRPGGQEGRRDQDAVSRVLWTLSPRAPARARPPGDPPHERLDHDEDALSPRPGRRPPLRSPGGSVSSARGAAPWQSSRSAAAPAPAGAAAGARRSGAGRARDPTEGGDDPDPGGLYGRSQMSAAMRPHWPSRR